MHIFLKPGFQVKVRDTGTGAAADATILRLLEEKIMQVSLFALTFHPGDRVEIEIPQREDALYIFNACVLAVGINQEYTLQRLSEPRQLQRRRSQRFPANHRAEYILFAEDKSHKDFREGLILNISGHGSLLAVKEPLQLNSKLFLLFKINLPGKRVVPTGIGGKVVREQFPPADDSAEWDYSYGVEFEKPFSALTG